VTLQVLDAHGADLTIGAIITAEDGSRTTQATRQNERDGPPAERVYSLARLLRWAASSFFTSSGESFGRSMVSVIFPILPVKANGTW